MSKIFKAIIYVTNAIIALQTTKSTMRPISSFSDNETITITHKIKNNIAIVLFLFHFVFSFVSIFTLMKLGLLNNLFYNYNKNIQKILETINIKKEIYV